MRQIHIAGPRVEGIGVGTAQFAFRNGTAEDSIATVHAALDAGVMLIDTALAYTRAGIESYAENVVARALRGVASERPVIATKGGHWHEGADFLIDGRPDTLRPHCEISLRTPDGPASVARQRLANRFDLDLPDNQRKLEAAGQLAQLADDAGISLIELAIAFVLRHPAITSAIIGPRTMEHLESQLTATGVHLTHDVLDRIDQIVAPGLTLNPADNGWVSPALGPAARR